MLKKVIIATTILAALGVLIIVNTTTPATIPPIGLLVFFVCVYVLTLGVATVLVSLAQRLKQRFSPKTATAPRLVRAYEYATVLALGPTILLALQTVGRLQFTDLLFTTVFVLLGCFYVSKRHS